MSNESIERQCVSTGTPWEKSVGYSRAVRVGPHVFVSGTTASDEDGRTVFVGDAYRQTQFILRKIGDALREVGAGPADVTRTRMFVTDISRWEEIGKAHGEMFGDIRPSPRWSKWRDSSVPITSWKLKSTRSCRRNKTRLNAPAIHYELGTSWNLTRNQFGFSR